MDGPSSGVTNRYHPLVFWSSTRNKVTIRGRTVTPHEVKASLDSRLPSPYRVTAKSPDGLDKSPPELDVAIEHGWSIHPWYVPEHAHLQVRFNPRDGDTDLQVEPAHMDLTNGVGFRGLLRGRVRRLLRTGTPELAAGPQRRVEDEKNRDHLVSLLGVYAGQFGSYTTLLWQVPALGLTAQAFLLTIALDYASSRWARCTASVLSIIIALASAVLMHNQRGREINHGELLRRISEKLLLRDLLGGDIELDDALPQKTNAQNVWAVDHFIYHAWIGCMCLFLIADGLVIISAALNLSWYK